ncbi:hypothetical protein GOP47_0030076 [Adiantum capillus-veneris]|nr:hypothetical protein GOP47_0030076 [Adiantum capillus-veneris]
MEFFARQLDYGTTDSIPGKAANPNGIHRRAVNNYGTGPSNSKTALGRRHVKNATIAMSPHSGKTCLQHVDSVSTQRQNLSVGPQYVTTLGFIMRGWRAMPLLC